MRPCEANPPTQMLGNQLKMLAIERPFVVDHDQSPAADQHTDDQEECQIVNGRKRKADAFAITPEK